MANNIDSSRTRLLCIDNIVDQAKQIDTYQQCRCDNNYICLCVRGRIDEVLTQQREIIRHEEMIYNEMQKEESIVQFRSLSLFPNIGVSDEVSDGVNDRDHPLQAEYFLRSLVLDCQYNGKSHAHYLNIIDNICKLNKYFLAHANDNEEDFNIFLEKISDINIARNPEYYKSLINNLSVSVDSLQDESLARLGIINNLSAPVDSLKDEALARFGRECHNYKSVLGDMPKVPIVLLSRVNDLNTYSLDNLTKKLNYINKTEKASLITMLFMRAINQPRRYDLLQYAYHIMLHDENPNVRCEMTKLIEHDSVFPQNYKITDLRDIITISQHANKLFDVDKAIQNAENSLYIINSYYQYAKKMLAVDNNNVDTDISNVNTNDETNDIDFTFHTTTILLESNLSEIRLLTRNFIDYAGWQTIFKTSKEQKLLMEQQNRLIEQQKKLIKKYNRYWDVHFKSVASWPSKS